eukprot:2845899-Prymnesium_polylepis.1
MYTAVRDLAAAVVAGGDLSRIGQVEAGIWDEDDKVALKAKIAGLILLLKDDSYAVVPTRRAVVQSGESLRLSVKVGSGPAEAKTVDWLTDNVKGAWLGVLHMDGTPGTHAKLACGSETASMTPVLTAGTGVTKVKVSVAGNGAVEKAVGEALDMLGLRSKMKAWAGGMVGAELRRGGDLPDDAAVAAAKVGAMFHR